MLQSNKKIFQAVLLAVCAYVLPPARASETSQTFEDLVIHERFAEVIADYSRLSSSDKSDACCCYMTAIAYMRRHDFNAAEPLLLHCEQEHFLHRKWESPQHLLDRIATFRRLTPPLYREFKDGAARLTVYGAHDKWLDEIYDVLPVFVKQANLAFSGTPTQINLYMFNNKYAYVEFFKDADNGRSPGANQSGTGSINYAVFSEFCLDGSTRGIHNLADRRGCVLHEYGHALCATIYGDDYFRVVPTWLNEGLADLIARPLFGPEFDKYPAEIARRNNTYIPPSYEVLSRQFYGKGPMPYTIAKLMVREIFGDSPLSTVGSVLAKAKSNNGDFDAAISDVMKVKPAEVYARLVRIYWPNQASIK